MTQSSAENSVRARDVYSRLSPTFCAEKEKKRVQKVVAETKQNAATSSTLSGIEPASLREAIQQIRTEPSPSTPEEQEQYFMSQVATGERLALEGIWNCSKCPSTFLNHSSGPNSYLPAAMSFFRALRVYPSPVELIVIYEKTIIEPVFKVRLPALFLLRNTELKICLVDHGFDSAGRK